MLWRGRPYPVNLVSGLGRRGRIVAIVTRNPGLTLSALWILVGLATIVAYWSQPPLARLRTSPTALELIKEREGLMLTAYRDPRGRLTIGYGHASDVTPGMTVSQREAERLFHGDIARIEREVKRHVRAPMTENEFSAMVALAYNIGADAFRRSTILAAFNDGDRTQAADAFLLWNKIRHEDGDLVPSVHLTKYRDSERRLFLGEGD